MNITSNSRVIGQLLQHISWVGNTVKAYRNGGQGFEDVLTAEVFLALDFLPRQSFLGAVILNMPAEETEYLRRKRSGFSGRWHCTTNR